MGIIDYLSKYLDKLDKWDAELLKAAENQNLQLTKTAIQSGANLNA